MITPPKKDKDVPRKKRWKKWLVVEWRAWSQNILPRNEHIPWKSTNGWKMVHFLSFFGTFPRFLLGDTERCFRNPIPNHCLDVQNPVNNGISTTNFPQLVFKRRISEPSNGCPPCHGSSESVAKSTPSAARSSNSSCAPGLVAAWDFLGKGDEIYYPVI